MMAVFLCAALGATGGRAGARCCLTTARRALVAGSPRPEAETGRRTDPTPSLSRGRGTPKHN
jgi:hypothetical protein